MAWRNCYASVALVDELNKRWPNRDRASDGTIGDAAHATRTSDHNPWLVLGGVGIVRARDVDKDGVDAAGLVEYLRQLGAQRDNRLYPGGYVIFNRRITTPDFSGWKTYTGSNPHTAHFHVSFSTVAAGFDSPRPWGIWPTTNTAASGGDWFDMATREDLAAVVNAAIDARLGRTIFETTGRIDNRRGPGGAMIENGGNETLFGYAANADGFGYRIEQLLTQVASRVGAGTGAPVALTPADRTAIATEVANLLAARLAQ
jgi:hypothetical protein